MTDYLLDTNVLSKYFAGDAGIKSFLDGIDYCIDTVVFIELIQGSIKKHDRELIKESLSTLTCHPLTPEISRTAIELIDKYSSAEGLFLADALIAATAIEHDLTLVTFNTKDFKFINEIIIIEPK